jgi:hypothetical protein
MKRLSIWLPAIALGVVLVLSGAAPAPKTAATTTVSTDNNHFQIMYYWYTYPGDVFVDYQSLNVEELEYWIWYGWFVNNDPRGGTLISKGWLVPTYPHAGPANILLYRH